MFLKVFSNLLAWRMRSQSFVLRRKKCVANAAGRTLELGAGSGLNIPYYNNTAVTELTLLEPNPHLQAEIKTDSPLSFTVVTGEAEHIPFPSDTFDSVVSTWVLCSVRDVDTVLAEVKRVLKPGGYFYFIEHGVSPNIFVRFIQNTSNSLWKYLALGCNLNRDYTHNIKEQGYEVEHYQQSNTEYTGTLRKL